MKKALLIITMLMGISLYTFAQGYVDVVYLKNGSIIRGHVIEQTPNKDLKIKTYDGSIFVYEMSEVEKIKKEEKSFNRRSGRVSNKPELRGYKGFVDAGYTFANDDFNSFGVSTTHGYQFNNYIFAGGGIGFQYFHEPDLKIVPIYGNFRVNFVKAKVAPFVDLKTGGTVGDYDGFYNSISLGLRISLQKRTALNVMIGYTYQQLEESYYHYDSSWGDYYYWDYCSVNGFSLKIGFEF